MWVSETASIACPESADVMHVSTGRYGAVMGIQRNSTRPAGITNASGQPEIVLEIDGLTISMAPPAPVSVSESVDGGRDDPKEDVR